MKWKALGIGMGCIVAAGFWWINYSQPGTVDRAVNREPSTASQTSEQNADSDLSKTEPPSLSADGTRSLPSVSDQVRSQSAKTATAVPAAKPPTPPAAAAAPKLRAVGSMIVQGLGPVRILDHKTERDPDGTKVFVTLVEAAGGKYSFFRVAQRDITEVSPPEIMVADQALVQFSPGIGNATVEKLLADNNLTLRKKFIHPGLYTVGVDTPSIDAAPDLVKLLTALGGQVEVAEPDYVMFPN